jgi:cell division protease FtsH
VLYTGTGRRQRSELGDNTLGNPKNLAFWAILLLLLVTVFSVFQGGGGSSAGTQLSFSDFLTSVEHNEVAEVVIDGENITGRMKDQTRFSTVQPRDADIVDDLRAADVAIRVEPQEGGGILSTLGFWLPMLVVFGIWIFFLNRMQAGGRGAMGFGKSKAKLLTERTGKTLLARAIAGEAGVPFFTISGSDFVEMFVGVGASRVRDMFEQAKKNAPCIVFIDEIDAVGRHRGVGYGGGNDEREQTLNQLLVEMDGFEANEGVILIAATNRPDVLDPALLRPGRFDRQVQVPNPDIKGREKILQVHARKVPLAPNVDLKIIARGTPGFSGADLANLINEAALKAARGDKRLVTMEDFEFAKDKVMMGAERRSMVMNEDEKKLTAYHEAGHAIVGQNVPQHDPVHKVTIIPRGRALGVTFYLPERDQLSVTKTKYTSMIASAMGGKVAEELVFGPEQVTSGASSDIQHITRIANAMVTQFGMSEVLGNIDYDGGREDFMGMRQAGMNVSPSTRKMIDEEVRRIVDEGYETAKRILTEKRADMEALAQGLLEYETLTGDEIGMVLRGEKIDRSDDGDVPPAAGDSSHAAVPKAGKPKRPDLGGEGDMEPQPQ